MKSLVPVLISLAASPWAGSRPDDAPDWYDPQWLAEAPYAPRFAVRDTVNKYGRYPPATTQPPTAGPDPA